MANDGLIVDSQGKPRGIDEVVDWQLDKTVTPHRIVVGVAGKTPGGSYVAVQVDGVGAVATGKSVYAIKITESGSDVYVAKAVVGSAQADPVWQAMKVNTTGGDTTVTWAETGGVPDSDFTHISTDLTTLLYS